ncbi:MAG: 23S rRNA (pseudouridine(1915)-N(3))-methyltransferase RlmH [Bacteroidaceae bacterium]|nr:23S rRNA (pseudouridine(1915)-N(3))-methyltransferase RlmH [Bacteroidaceae bacterium]
MKLSLLVIGRTTDRHIQALIDDYSSRLSHYVPFGLEVIPELKSTRALSAEQQKTAEAELLRKQLQPGDHIVLLDEHGSERRSMDFAGWLQKRMAAGAKRIVFIVGGPYGFDPTIHALAAEEISLSQMTFSHQLIRVLFVEQLYRAFTILRGEPYHHE